jgi:cellulose synthase/poly-beta-1,6-N-acetylglucosamine synthase-like glycosyltransferase
VERALASSTKIRPLPAGRHGSVEQPQTMESRRPLPRRRDAITTAPEPPRYDYERYSQLTGPLIEPLDTEAVVSYQRLPHARPRRQLLGAIVVLLIQSAFLAWLLLPSHLPLHNSSPVIAIASIVMLCSIYLIELFRLLNVTSLCLASALARDPIPMVPQRGTRVAFLTTIVPAKESISVVEPTLRAARKMRHSGTLDIWLLDEGNDPAIRRMCAELGVRHFSRHGVERWNQATGRYKARTKHGNYNAWVDCHGDGYDFFVSLDPDHVPLPSFCERLLGYFRDPEVAFVVGPQVYGNYDNFVTKCAESQQFVFHGLIQRMGNYFGSPMLVGTNNAVRIAALKDIGGLRDSITEDLATSLICHSSRNPRTGRPWKSVYTPDVLAVGEGPANFTDFFSQQHRWSRGTFESLRGNYWRCLRSLSPGARLHYSLITSYYPTAAIGWILGAVNCMLYLLFGASGIRVQPSIWVAVYIDLAVVQFSLYASNRKHNVSPHESSGSSGIGGMFISVLAAPIYVVALIGTLLRTGSSFVVTPKGSSQSIDRLATFRWHLWWGSLLGVALGVSLWMNHAQSSMRLWSLTLICVCLTPSSIALTSRARLRRRNAPVRTAEVGILSAPRDHGFGRPAEEAT